MKWQNIIPLAVATLAITAALKSPADNTNAVSPAADKRAVATFAGGCFWCVESDFDAVPGVLETVSGYTGGSADNPTYKNHMRSGHREVVQISYDPSVTNYEKLLHVFWRSVDPTDGGGQFCDRGHSYSTAIYAHDDAQLAAAQQSKQALAKQGTLPAPVVTEVTQAAAFWPAEDYHQDYYQKNPIRYNFYRSSCGRDKRVKKVWGDMAHSGIEKH